MYSCFRCWGLLVVGVGLLAGCSGGGPDTHPVSGSVKYEGKPVEGVQVTFMLKEGGSRAAFGTTDAEGKFQLSTSGTNDGAEIGVYTVTIVETSSSELSGFDAENPSAGYGEAMAGGGSSGSGGGKIPKKYADAGQSGLEGEVTAEGPNQFDFVLE